MDICNLLRHLLCPSRHDLPLNHEEIAIHSFPELLILRRMELQGIVAAGVDQSECLSPQISLVIQSTREFRQFGCVIMVARSTRGRGPLDPACILRSRTDTP